MWQAIKKLFSTKSNQESTHSWIGKEFDQEHVEVLDNDISRHGQHVPYDENLLERARTQWQFGDWESLAGLERETLQHHPDRAKLALLAAAGRLQTDNSGEARQYLRLAQDWGVSKTLLAQILAAGVHNSLGRVAALANQQSRAIKHFQSAIAVGSPAADTRLLVQARIETQFNQIGLMDKPDGYLTSDSSGTTASWSSSLKENKVALNEINQISIKSPQELAREILIEELNLSKKALIARRRLTKRFITQAKVVDSLVSVILPTRRPNNIKNIIKNLSRQTYKKIELILIPHFYDESDLKNMDKEIDPLRQLLSGVVILKMDDSIPLGTRLNKAIEQAQGEYWAKMDDDDAYYENYLSDMLLPFALDDYAVVGKSEQFVYLSESKKMLLKNPLGRNRLSFVSGATFVISKKNGGLLRFGELEKGEDTALINSAKENKLKVYAADPFNHVVIRSISVDDHTWKEDSAYFLKQGAVVCDGFCTELVKV